MTSGEPIRRAVTVRSTPQHAFEVFTEQMGTWWPLESYSRAYNEFAGKVECVRLEFQAHLGGAIIEHLSDGTALPWAEITVWEPPRRVVMAWRPHSLPEPPTELEVIFTGQADGTVVELEHRGWERLSESFRATLYDVYVRGWLTTLGLFVAEADRA